MSLISPTGTPISIRPIHLDELDRVPLRCWPERGILERIFEDQGTIGMAAWEGEKCVAQLHCYRVLLPDQPNPYWPDHNNWRPVEAWRNDAPSGLDLKGSVWCHACTHVGRTIEGNAADDRPDARYAGRGIGSALARASVQWAKEHDYIGVFAPGAGLFAAGTWMGSLPLTTYAKLGFQAIGPQPEDALPDWAKGDSPPEVMAEVESALAAGRPPKDFHGRLMLLDLRANG